ncbi:hypothetical protein ASG33_25050 [Dyadobacter sp. Leaf189]|nr:hypothetical protein ASG33_25050 [Dyadobacter sp. Leaf189]
MQPVGSQRSESGVDDAMLDPLFKQQLKTLCPAFGIPERLGKQQQTIKVVTPWDVNSMQYDQEKVGEDNAGTYQTWQYSGTIH